MNATRPPSRLTRDPRVAFGVFVATCVVAGALMLWWGRHLWFFIDDWDFLVPRSVGNLGDLARPHYQHWTLLPFVAYRFLWWLVGLRSYLPYQLLVVLAHLGVAALLRVVMRRAGVGPWLATGTASLFVFFGSGAENILVAFQVTFAAALAFGLVQLLSSDHDGPVDRRDWLGLAAGLAALMCSGVAVTMIAVVGLTMLVRRGWRTALLHTVPLLTIYLVWLLAAPAAAPGQTAGNYRARSLGEVLRFTAVGIQAMFGGLAGRRGLGFLFAVVLVAGLVLVVRRRGRTLLDGPATASLALLAGAITFLVVTAVFRSGQGGLLVYFARSGAERARQGRYVYVVAAMALPALALAANAIIEYRRRLAVVIAAVLAIGIVGNVERLRTFTIAHASRSSVLNAPRLPVARKLPRTAEVSPNLQLGWLLDNLGSGRIPAAPPLSPRERATLTLQLALVPSSAPQTAPCTTVNDATIRRLRGGESLTVQRGNAWVASVPIDGTASRRLPLQPSTVVALVPLRLSIEPVAGPIVLCG